jgi:hypothetical protein
MYNTSEALTVCYTVHHQGFTKYNETLSVNQSDTQKCDIERLNLKRLKDVQTGEW